MSPAEKLIALCVLGAALIEAEQFARVLIHRASLANLSHDSEGSESNGSDCKQSNHQDINHLASPLMPDASS